MQDGKIKIPNVNGDLVDAQTPIIISASRATDIPAFYSNWLINRIKSGYVKKKNPFNGKFTYVSFQKARLFVFWSKNPNSLIKYLDDLDALGYNYYFQFTLNDYDLEKLEPNVPSLRSRIDAFLKLSERIGRDKVIWRFDPLIMTDKIGVSELLKKVDNIGNQLKDHTNKLVFSFADIDIYKKVKNNLQANAIKYAEFNEETMREFARELQKLNSSWNFKLATCAERINLKEFGIEPNKCIDDDLIIKLFSDDKKLMDFLGVKIAQKDLFNPNSEIIRTKNNKDKGQREFCGCIVSKDIGEYNSCPHCCEYCYANISKNLAIQNWKAHNNNFSSESILY